MNITPIPGSAEEAITTAVDPQGYANTRSSHVTFWSRVEKTDGCWLWAGPERGNGYGGVHIGDSYLYAHRLSYEIAHGPIPAGLSIDHLCRVRKCVNPDHLEAVPQKVNIQRGQTGAHQRAKTHCPQGHPYDSINTLIYKGRRYCRACGNQRRREYRARKAARND